MRLKRKPSHDFYDNIKDEWDLGQTDSMEHEIDTEDSKPVKQPPRKVPIALADEERDAILNLRERGTIQYSTSPWASPLVLARKKNGKIKVCVDYRRVNNLTKTLFHFPEFSGWSYNVFNIRPNGWISSSPR